jgi:hypothetical protein
VISQELYVEDREEELKSMYGPYDDLLPTTYSPYAAYESGIGGRTF